MIVLASKSPLRKEILKDLGYDFIVCPAKKDEVFDLSLGLDEALKKVAESKAKEVREFYSDSIIISADTIVCLDDKILGKPKSEEEAYKMLKDLSGKVHRVYSAVVVVNSKTNKVKKECIFTEVKFKDLTNEEILKYISTKEPLDKAGAYGIQGFGGVFVERINGCYYNVVGLPLNLLNNILEEIK